MSILKDFIKSMTAFFLFPFRFIILGVNELEYSFYQLKDDLFNHRIKKQNQRKEENLKLRIMNQNITRSNKIRHFFILFSTSGLQFISFFTTFAGTNYYFGNITQPKFLGPFIITCVIQFSLLFLSNTIVYHENKNKNNKVMLTFFLVVSILFSYAGMIHTIVPPHKEMKSNYEDFIRQYDNVYKVYQAQFHINEDVFTNVESKVNELQIALKNQVSSTKVQLDATPQYSSTSSSSNTTINVEGDSITTNSSSQTINPEWTKLNALYQSLQNTQKQLSKLFKQVKTPLAQAVKYESESEQIQALKHIEDADAFISTFNQSIHVLGEEYTIEPIINFETLYYQIQSNVDLQKHRCLTYEEIEEQIQQKMHIEASNSNLEYLNAIANTIDEQIRMYEKSPLFEEDLNITAIEQSKIIKLKQASIQAKTIQDFNALAFGYLNPVHPLFSKAIITFVFALFIDITTFLIPYFMDRSKKSFLYMNKKKEMNEEEILTQLLQSTTNNQFYQHAVQLKDDLLAFLNLFEISSNEAMEDGYALRSEQSKLEHFMEEKRYLFGFIVYALNAHYLYQDENQIYQAENKIYMRTKFSLWLQTCIHSLSKYIEDEMKGSE